MAQGPTHTFDAFRLASIMASATPPAHVRGKRVPDKCLGHCWALAAPLAVSHYPRTAS